MLSAFLFERILKQNAYEASAFFIHLGGIEYEFIRNKRFISFIWR